MKKILSKLFNINRLSDMQNAKGTVQRIDKSKLKQIPDEFVSEAEKFKYDPDVQAHSAMDLKTALSKLNFLRGRL